MGADGGKRVRPSRRTFVVRRLVVAGVLGAVVFGVVLVVVTLTRGDDGGTADGSVPTAAPGTVVAPAPLPPPTDAAVPTEPRVPSVSDPAGVLLVGDSEAQGLEPFLEAALDLDGLTTLTTDGRNSTGLVRSDAFDWPAHLRELVPSVAPDIVVAFFGGNDGQSFIDMPTDPVDSPEWRDEYARRVGEVMDLLRADGRTLIWIGVPAPGDADLRARLSVQDAVVNEQLAERPDVIFIDSWTLFAGIDGSVAPLVLDPLSGNYVAVRAERDQFHLNVAGTKILAAAVGQAINDDLARRGADVSGAQTPTTVVDPQGPGRYTIADGDTLIGIAAKTGTTVDAIVAENGWADENHVIFLGQTIMLPARTAATPHR